MTAVAEPAVEVVLLVTVATPQFIWVHMVEVKNVCGVGNGGDVGRHLLLLVASVRSEHLNAVHIDLDL